MFREQSRIFSQDRFKLDTRASGNLLPLSVYHEQFPDHNIKDLGKTINKSVHLLTATKSSIKQLGTVCLKGLSLPSVISHTHLFL